MVSIEIEESTK